jgi:hypothetical protein
MSNDRLKKLICKALYLHDYKMKILLQMSQLNYILINFRFLDIDLKKYYIKKSNL